MTTETDQPIDQPEAAAPEESAEPDATVTGTAACTVVKRGAVGAV